MTDSDLVKNLRFEFLKQSRSFSDDVVLRNPMSIRDFARICTLENELWPVNDERRNNFCKKSDNLFTHQITDFIQRNLVAQRMGVGKKKPLVLKIHGHASSGKSTAIQQISKYLRDEVDNETLPLLPIYSEFQSAEKSFNLHSTTIWDRFVAGTQSIDFRFDTSSKSIESFKKFTSESNVLPLLIIDTVDFLAIPKEDNIGTDWSSFLDELIKSNINVIFTVRTNEWELNFDSSLSLDVRNCMASIALPELMLSEIDNYKFDGATSQKKFNQFTRVLGAFLPMLRNKSIISKPGDFSSKFFEIIDKWFELHTNKPMKAFQRHPVSLFYNLSWRQIGNESSSVMNFKQTFENYVLEEISKHFATYNSGRIFFDEYEFYQYASQQVSIEECEELFDDLVDFGVIRRVGKLFEFHHHLFVEHIIEQNPDAVPPGMLFEFDRDDERLYGCVKAWCDDKTSKIAHKHEQRVHEFYPRAKYDLAPEQEEEQEHKLLKFFSDDQDKRRIQLLSGSAGTGKSIYSLKFIDHQFHYRTTAARACYITKSEELLQSQISRWKNREMDGILRNYESDWDDGKRDHKVEFESVRKLLQTIVPEETTKKKFVDFEEFSSIWKNEWDGKRGYDSSRDSTSIEIAWLELNESFFNEYGQEIPKPEFKYTGDEDSKSKGLANFILPTEKRGSIAPYSHWAYLARERILKSENQSSNSYDFIVVDEVQDLHPSVVAFLMLLIRDPVEQENSKKGSIQLRKNIALKQLLLTGDEYQTLNQSGFDWVKLLERVQMISQKEKFDKHSILIDKWNDINLSSQDGSIFLEVLKYSYRNPQSIVSFNRSAFRSYNYAFESILNSEATAKFTKDKFAKFETIVPRNRPYKPAKIVFVPIADNNYADAIKHLNDVLWLKRQYLGSPQLLYPHHIDFDQLTGLADQKSLDDFASRMKIYSSGGVKGLETGAVCVMHPFEMDKSSFVPGKQQERKFSAVRYDNLVNSQSKQLMERIHENMIYRMNVLFTRSESLIFILWPGGLGEEPSEFWWENDRYMRRVYPWSFNNLKQFKDVNIVESYLDVNEEFLTKIFDGYTQELGADYWERQALEALIRKDDDENQKKAFEQYFENVPEDQRNIGHTIALLSGYSDHFLIRTLFGPKYSDSTEISNKASSTFQQRVSDFGVRNDKDALLNIFDSIYLDENSPLVSKEQRIHFNNLGHLIQHYSAKNHPFRTPSDYLSIVYHLHDFITNVVLKDRDYLETTEFGDRAISAIWHRLTGLSPSKKSLDDYLSQLFSIKTILQSIKSDITVIETENFQFLAELLGFILSNIEFDFGISPIASNDHDIWTQADELRGHSPFVWQTVHLIEGIFRLSNNSPHSMRLASAKSRDVVLLESCNSVDFWELMHHIPKNLLIFTTSKNYNKFISSTYQRLPLNPEDYVDEELTFSLFIDSHVKYIRKKMSKVFFEISKQNSDYDQPCFDILIEYLVRSVEIPDKGFSWKDQEYDWGDIDGMFLVMPILIMNADLSNVLDLNRFKHDAEVLNMVYERIYRELKILEHGINPADEKYKSILAKARAMPISQILFCYQNFISYLIVHRPNSQYIARTNDIVVAMVQSYDKIKGKKANGSLFSVSQKKLDQFAQGLFDINQRHFGRYIGSGLMLSQQNDIDEETLRGLYFCPFAKVNKLLSNVVGEGKLTAQFASGLVGSLRGYLNYENSKIQSLTKFGKEGKPQYLKISNILKQMCHSISSKQIDDRCVQEIIELFGEIKPPLAVNLDYIHNSGDVDGWSILRPSAEGKTSDAIERRIHQIFERRCESLFRQLSNLERNRDKSFGSLRFIFEDLNQITDQSYKRSDYFKEIKPIPNKIIDMSALKLSKSCPSCGGHRKELNWSLAPGGSKVCNACSVHTKANDYADYILRLLFSLHQVLIDRDNKTTHVSFEEALKSSEENYRNNNPELPIVGTKSSFMTASKFGEYTDLLTSFRENIQTPFESILLNIAEKISDEYEQSKRADQKNKWLGIFDSISTFQNLDSNYNATGINALMSRLDTLILSTIGCTSGSFFEIKDSKNWVYNYNMVKSLIEDEHVERKLRRKKLDSALGRTRKPQSDLAIGSKELRKKMEMLSYFDDDLPSEAKRCIVSFAEKYEDLKLNRPKKFIEQIKHQILSKYDKSGSDFIPTEELFGVPITKSTITKDEILSCFESSNLQWGKLVKVTNYLTKPIGQKSLDVKRLLTYLSTSWIDIEKIDDFISPHRYRQKTLESLDELSINNLKFSNVRINNGAIEMAEERVWDQFFDGCNQFCDWFEDISSLREFVGTGIYSYESLENKITDYCIDRINEQNSNPNNDPIVFSDSDCEDLFIYIVFRNYFLVQFHELGNNFYSFDRIDTRSISNEIEQIISELPFSSTMDVVNKLTVPTETDEYEFIDFIETILENNQHPLLITINTDENRVWITKRFAKEKNYKWGQNITKDIE